MKRENKKSIEANLRNKLAAQYKEKSDNLQERIKGLDRSLREMHQRARKAEMERDDLKDKLQQYEDWNNRLMEFMDMSDQDRQTYLENMKCEAQINARMNGLLGSRIFSVLSML